MAELTVKVVSGTSENLHLQGLDLATTTVQQLKTLIQQQNPRRFPVSAQRLIFQGQILQDAKLLTDYHVASGCALHLTLTPGAVAAANAAADRAAASAGPAPPAQLRAYLQLMQDQEPHDMYATAVRTLQKICGNIVDHPTEDKYRRLRVDNAALKAKLFDRTRGQESCKLIGFQDGVQAGHLVLVPTPEKWENLVACKAVVDSVATTLGGAMPAASPFGAAPSMAGMGGLGGMGGGAGMGGDFAAQAQALLQNPGMLQQMASNPMVQQMAQQNPMLAQALQNPAMLTQSLQALQQNPGMMQQMQQMMSDPSAMAHMQQMMAGGGMGGMGGLGGYGGSPFGAAAPAAAAANPFASGSSPANPFATTSTPLSAPAPAAPVSTASAPTPAPASTAAPAAASASSAAVASTDDTDESFEEDEIAKAIARSLQDHSRSPPPRLARSSRAVEAAQRCSNSTLFDTIATALGLSMAGEQQQTPADKSGGASASPSNGGSGAQALAPLPFDESLVAALSAASSSMQATQPGMTSSKSAADFFLDQIAAVVSDEKKLSDNIMDLIPPVEAPMSQAAAVTAAMTSSSMSMGMPLQPPPGLMMRALSPPTSLLPDFGDVAPLSLLGDVTASAATTSSGAIAMPASMAAPATTTVTTAVKRELPVVKPAVAGATAAMRRKAELATAASVAHKKQKTENMKPEPVVKAAAPTPVSVHQQIQQQQARHHLNNNPLGASAAAAAAAAAAREKVMKEPQSGDLYECVITKRNGGLGLTLACVDDHVQITGLAPDTPAANSGICVGDTLVAVSGLPVRGLQFSTVIGRLKSTSRNSVVLKLRRNPFRQNAGNSASYRGIKRPGRGMIKGADSSNSANVLSSKTMALETRLGGGLGNGLNGAAGALSASNNLHNGNGSSGLDELHRSHQGATGFATHAASLHHLHHLQMPLKAEPTNSTYFPTDASILTMGVTASGSSGTGAVPPSALAPPSSVPSDTQAGWRVGLEEKDRYFAECRALRHELGRAMVAQRVKKRDTEAYTAQLQAVADKFQKEVKALLPATSTAASASTDTVTSGELATLRQKLVEANQALAKQQTEMLALQERESRHAVPEAQRVKWQLVSHMRKSVLQIDCKAAAKLATVPVVKKIGAASGSTSSFEERMEGVRPSAFALLVGQSSVKPGSPTTELDLDSKACTELLGWNLREVVVQAGGTYTVSVADAVHVKYMRTEEALVVSWTLSVKDSSNRK